MRKANLKTLPKDVAEQVLAQIGSGTLGPAGAVAWKVPKGNPRPPRAAKSARRSADPRPLPG
ncbi:hypothetical protein ACIP2Y_39260 [Streptomyces sviceus]|uniref:hypothetical protein n=1 Tax=Streptomyces sviceus TaxID=285530 RepID=UPI003830DE7F